MCEAPRGADKWGQTRQVESRMQDVRPCVEASGSALQLSLQPHRQSFGRDAESKVCMCIKVYVGGD